MKKFSGWNNTLKNKKHTGFSLSELLVTLAAVSILTAILFPIARAIMPNQSAIMAKRSLTITQSAISEALNDSNCYPELSNRVGIDDGSGYLKCPQWHTTGSEGDAGEKFVKVFTSYLDLKKPYVKVGNNATFMTKDGMHWEISNLDTLNKSQNKGKEDVYITISIDTNGNKGPNCGESEKNSGGQCESIQKEYDQFTMRVYATGKVRIEDCWAVSATKIDKKLHQDSSEGQTFNTCTEIFDNPEAAALAGDGNEASMGGLGLGTSSDMNCPTTYIPKNSNDICCQNVNHQHRLQCNTCYPKANHLNTSECCENFLRNTLIWGDFTQTERETCSANTEDEKYSTHISTRQASDPGDEDKNCDKLSLANVSATCCKQWKEEGASSLPKSMERACEAQNIISYECIEERATDLWGEENPCSILQHIHKIKKINTSNPEWVTGKIYENLDSDCSKDNANTRTATAHELTQFLACAAVSPCGVHPYPAFGRTSLHDFMDEYGSSAFNPEISQRITLPSGFNYKTARYVSNGTGFMTQIENQTCASTKYVVEGHYSSDFTCTAPSNYTKINSNTYNICVYK